MAGRLRCRVEGEMRATTWDVRMLWIAVVFGSLFAVLAAMFSFLLHGRRVRVASSRRVPLPGRVGGVPRSLRVRR